MIREQIIGSRTSFDLKATPADQSSCIIQSFHEKWKAPLIKSEIRVVFRKKGPKQFTPKTMYAYISTPTSAIVAKMPVLSCEFLPLDEAVQRATRGAISEDELRHYAKTNRELVVIEIGKTSVAKTPITLDYLVQTHGFWPSANFIPLSNHGVDVLDQLGDFH